MQSQQPKEVVNNDMTSSNQANLEAKLGDIKRSRRRSCPEAPLNPFRHINPSSNFEGNRIRGSSKALGSSNDLKAIDAGAPATSPATPQPTSGGASSGIATPQSVKSPTSSRRGSSLAGGERRRSSVREEIMAYDTVSKVCAAVAPGAPAKLPATVGTQGKAPTGTAPPKEPTWAPSTNMVVQTSQRDSDQGEHSPSGVAIAGLAEADGRALSRLASATRTASSDGRPPPGARPLKPSLLQRMFARKTSTAGNE